jgi:2-alkyl-3-oxoalkanoate reductase
MAMQSPVLVTGGTGFIGRTLIDELLAQGLEVASFALPGEAVPSLWGNRVKIHRGDITSAADVNAAMQGAKTVFHLAAIVGMGAYQAHEAITVQGSQHVFDAALANNCKVVLAASIVVYGDQIQTRVCHEGLPHGKHQGPYSWAKMAQEKLALDYQGKGMQLTVIRPANVYGVGSGPWVEGLLGAIEAGMLPVVGDGSGNAGLVHVKNLVSAFILAANSEQAAGRVYTVCDGLDVSWSQYIHDLAAMKGIEELPFADRDELIAAARQFENPEKLQITPDMPTIPLEMINLIGYDNRFDCARIRDELGWKPHFSYEQALAEIRLAQSK